MKRSCCSSRLLFVLLWLCSLPVQASGLPQPTESYVNDFANLLSEAERESLRNRLHGIRKERGVEITLVTQQQKPVDWQGRSIEAYATALFNDWGVGSRERNDGIMLLVIVADREARIELGKFYGRQHDGNMQRLMDRKLVPLFREQQWSEAMHRALDGFEQLHRSPESPLPVESDSDPVLWLLGLGGAAALTGGAGLVWFRRHQRNKSRQCQRCLGAMVRLSEDIDDRHLDKGQQKEESLGSVDYDVWKCSYCDNVEIIPYKAWFHSAETCPQCRKHTGKSERTPYSPATGGYYLNITCQHCQHHWSRLVRHSQSSRSGGGFGGGSSGGGGATGRW